MTVLATATVSRRRGSREYDHLRPLFDELAAPDLDEQRQDEVRDRLVVGHLPLAKHIARRFSGKGIADDDLFQVAVIGLIHAVDRFDPCRGTEFLSYAVPTMMGEVRRHFRDASWPMRMPRRLQEMHLAVNEATNTLMQQLGRAVTSAEIARQLGVSADDVDEGLAARQSCRAVSLDEPAHKNDTHTPLAETVGEQDRALEQVVDHESLLPLLRDLPWRERRILALRYCDDLTQTQIAERVGVSQMHVSRLLTRTLRALRRGLNDEPAHAVG